MKLFPKFNLFTFLVIAAILACQAEVLPSPEKGPEDDSVFFAGVSKGKIESGSIREASGLAAGINNPGSLWAHNDSGDEARIFLMKENGTHLAEYVLESLENRDWEDIASGPGPVEGKNYLYIGNIGDNRGQYDQVYIYRIEEPVFSGSNAAESQTIPASEIETITIEYPDGPRDAESLMIDPLTKDIYIISKREESVNVYKLAYPQSVSGTVVPEKVGKLPFTWITAGDISADGKEILLKTYDEVFYWQREEGQSIADVLKSTPVRVPYKKEPQGEAIAWGRDRAGFFTTSELFTNPDAILYFYQRK